MVGALALVAPYSSAPEVAEDQGRHVKTAGPILAPADSDFAPVG